MIPLSNHGYKGNKKTAALACERRWGLCRCVQKAKEVWFRGIFNLHSVGNKGLAVALRAVVQADWGWRGGERRRNRQDHRPHLFPSFLEPVSLYSHWRAAFPLSHTAASPSQSCKCMTCGINWKGRRWGGGEERRGAIHLYRVGRPLFTNALSNGVVCIRLASPRLASSTPDGLMWKLQTCWSWCPACIQPPAGLSPFLTLWPPSRAIPRRHVCVSWRNCLLSCADQINTSCL